MNSSDVFQTTPDLSRNVLKGISLCVMVSENVERACKKAKFCSRGWKCLVGGESQSLDLICVKMCVIK